MNITLFLSTKRFNHKPTKSEKQSLTFQKQTVSVEELYNHIICGGAFSNLYDFDFPTNFSAKQTGDAHPKINHYIGSYTINIDLDHKVETMDECYDRVSLKPTWCYTTSSNGASNPDPKYKNGIEYSYRFIYVFDELIQGKDLYLKLYGNICSTQNLNFDVRACSPYQNMFGNYNSESKFPGTIYSIKDFNVDSECSIVKEKVQKGIIQTHNQHNNNPFCTFVSPTFYSDFQELDYNKIIEKYQSQYRNIEHSPFPIVDKEEKMIELPQDFYEITRFFKVNGNHKGECVRICYGHHRKRLLYYNLIIRRLITPDLSVTELLYDLCYEMAHYIDNTNKDHIITKEDLLKIARSAINADIEKYRCGYKRPRERMVNQDYVTNHNTTKRKVAIQAATERHQAKKKELSQKIGELYDCQLKDKENLQVLLDNGVNISLRKLKYWKKENGLTKVRRNDCQKPCSDDLQQTFEEDVVNYPTEDIEANRMWFFTSHSRFDDWCDDIQIGYSDHEFVIPEMMLQQSSSCHY